MKDTDKANRLKIKRRVAEDKLSFLGTQMVLVNHELWRLCHGPLTGLTPKEEKFLQQRLTASEKLQNEISKLRERLKNVEPY